MEGRHAESTVYNPKKIPHKTTQLRKEKDKWTQRLHPDIGDAFDFFFFLPPFLLFEFPSEVSTGVFRPEPELAASSFSTAWSLTRLVAVGGPGVVVVRFAESSVSSPYPVEVKGEVSER